MLFFGEALHYELRKTGVTVTVVSPGVTKTEFLDVAGQQPSLYQRTMMMESPDVTRIAVDAMLKGKASVVPGYKNAALAQSTATNAAPARRHVGRSVDDDGHSRIALSSEPSSFLHGAVNPDKIDSAGLLGDKRLERC